jgi:cytoplasmic iron level regulating protein YaaA (DUF328/UPF0246 family)
MQIILSPAKLFDFSAKTEKTDLTKPLFPDKTRELVSLCQQMSESEISSAMKINPKMAREVYEYFQTFDFDTTPKSAAALAYNGIAYKGLNAHDFSKEDFNFAQNHLNIISALYGILRPLDEIKPYRLEMMRKIVPQGYKTLYAFWQESLNAHLSEKLRNGENTIINVASNEYSKVFQKSKLPKGVKIIDIQFLQQENGNLKQIVVHSKKARGLMARFIIKNKLTKSEEVKAFDYEDYFFYPSLSDENRWTFVR